MSNPTSRQIVKSFTPSDEDIEQKLAEVMAEGEEALMQATEETGGDTFKQDTILKGTVVGIQNDEVIVDVKYKCEGLIAAEEWGETPPGIGDQVEVYLEGMDDKEGMLELSKRKADRLRGWERIIETHNEGDVVKGNVIRKIKGGLLVDIGIPVFLPASQIEIRRAGDVSQYIGNEIQARIIKIDESRMNIVISRRKLLEESREEKKSEILGSLEEGQIRRGVVKNIAEFGAFVDLGGIDGLLHITDMAWSRISHPSEMLGIDETIEVKVLKFDRTSERIALGLKQKQPAPWTDIEQRYQPGMHTQGEVVNVMSYGAFIKLEEGIEGLVHVSEMSWTRRINHPNEMVAVADVVDVVVLNVNGQKQEISLGMKQIEANPWETVREKYPVGTIIRGEVRNLTNYGAFVEIEEGIDGLLHVSDMSWTRKVNHPNEVVKKGDLIEAIVLEVDQNKKRIALGTKQLVEDPWEYEIPNRYLVGADLEGKVTKITNFGVFVELEDDLEGLLHISELAETKVDDPEEVVSVGNVVKVKVIKVNPDERKIGLTLLDVMEGAVIASDSGVASTEAADADDIKSILTSTVPGSVIEEPEADVQESGVSESSEDAAPEVTEEPATTEQEDAESSDEEVAVEPPDEAAADPSDEAAAAESSAADEETKTPPAE